MPFALVLHGINVIMGYPVRISVEYGVVEITFLKFIGSVKNRFYAVMRLYSVEPGFNGRFQFQRRSLTRSFHIKNGRKVSF
jgi:hypothetical protein